MDEELNEEPRELDPRFIEVIDTDEWMRWMKFSHHRPAPATSEEIAAARAGVLRQIMEIGAAATPDAQGQPDPASAEQMRRLQEILGDEAALAELAILARSGGADAAPAS